MAGSPYRPSQQQLEAHERRRASLTLSPTPLYSTFSHIDPAYETDDAAEGADFLPNVALNASCVLSSSGSAAGTFCRITDDGQTLATASEESAFVVVALEDLYYVDHISFDVDVDAASAQSKLLIWCSKSAHVDMTRASVDGLPYSWQKELLHDSSSLSMHVRAPCSYVRVQRRSFGPLRVHDLRVFGAKIRNGGCTAATPGASVCSARGACVDGACACAIGFGGAHCETVALPALLVSAAQAAVLVALFVGLTMYCRRVSGAALAGRVADAADAGTEKLAREDAAMLRERGDAAVRGEVAIPPAPQQLCPVRASSLFDDDSLSASSSRSTSASSGSCFGASLGSLLPGCPDMGLRSSSSNTAPAHEGDLHMLFASPLIMAARDDGGFRPIQGLDIQREYLLLRRSLRNAALALGGARGSEVPVSVSCATVESFHTLMTVGSARCLHFSGHCTSEFMAFEDAAGQLHSVSMDMLRGLLRSTVTARSFDTLRLVVLNACSSEAAGREFVLAGVAHVIAYRKRVRDVSAATFTRAFYLALACGRTVRDAFDSAKEAVQAAPNFCAEELDSFVLMPERASHAEVIWRRRNSGSNSIDASGGPAQRALSRRWPATEGMNSLPPLCEDFVGRHAATWAILRHLMVDRRRVLAVHGGAGSGKTQLALAVAHFLHQRRSATVLRDGVFFVRAPALQEEEGADDQSDVRALAALLDAVWEALSPMLADEANPMARARSCPSGAARDTLDDDLDDWPLDAEQQQLLHATHDVAPLLPLAAGSDAAGLQRRVNAKAAALAQLCAARGARCLLVLDGVRESAAVAGFLARLLERSAGVRVLLTARQPFRRGDALNVNVINYQLQPLQAGDAALLLVRHLKRKLVLPDAHGSTGAAQRQREASLLEVAQHQGLLAHKGNPRSIIQAALALSGAADVDESVLLDRLHTAPHLPM